MVRVFVDFETEEAAFDFIKHVTETGELLIGYGRGEIEDGYAVPAKIPTLE